MNPNKPSLTIATSQFPISQDISRNLGYIIKHTKLASKAKADIIHFPELALSGYDTDINLLDWNKIKEALNELKQLASKENINIVIGVHQKNPKNNLPFNCTYLITPKGEVTGYYIKSSLYAKDKEQFSQKENYFTYDINGVKCGFLICYDSSFPELFQEYRRVGTKLLFLSYFNANSSKPKNSMNELMRAQFITRACDNNMYISGSNSSTKYSRMPSSFVCPDGTVTSLKRHQPGILISHYPKDDLGWTYDNRK